MKRKLLRPHFGLNKNPRCYKKWVLCITLALATTTTILAEDDDYLKQLAAEADKTHLQTNSANKRDAAKQKQFKQMERMLANDRPTTYKFYKKLNNENKEKVLNIHISKNKLSLTSKTIMDLYFSN